MTCTSYSLSPFCSVTASGDSTWKALAVQYDVGYKVQVAFANAVIMIDITFIILKAKRVGNFPSSVLTHCWAGGA